MYSLAAISAILGRNEVDLHLYQTKSPILVVISASTTYVLIPDDLASRVALIQTVQLKLFT